MVALPGVGHMPVKGEDEQEAAQVFYAVATRAAQRLKEYLRVDGLNESNHRYGCGLRSSANGIQLATLLPLYSTFLPAFRSGG